MFSTKVGRFGACVGSAAAVYSISKRLQAKDVIDCHDCRMKRLPKARELPLYDRTEDNFTAEFDKPKLPLVNEISNIRIQVSGAFSYVNVVKDEAIHFYETGVAHSRGAYDYINSEENKIPRVLAIATGGLFGIILARKGGYFRKAMYGSLGTTIVFTAFYPATAKEYFHTSLEHTKYYTTDALEKYGGYDTKKLSDALVQKFANVKNALQLDGFGSSVKEWIDKNKNSISKSLSSMTGSSPNTEQNESAESSN